MRMLRSPARSLAHIGAVLFYGFLYTPIAVLILFSFNNATFPSPWKEWTFRWYVQLAHATPLWEACGVSLFVACTTVALSIGLSMGFMYYAMKSVRLRLLARAFYLNLVIPEIIIATGLIIIFSMLSAQLGLGSLIIGHTLLALGYMVPLVCSRYEELDPRLLEASYDLGASRWQTYWRVVIPLLRETFLTTSLLVFVLSFDDFVLSYFCSGSQVQTLPLYIFSMIRSGVSPVVNALATLLLLASAVFVALYVGIARWSAEDVR